MADQYGASQAAWHHWAETLGLAEHLLPVVANPDATISPDSRMKAFGKTPSWYNFKGEVAGIPKWTERTTTFKDVGKWELEPDYGICVQARALRAFDIDVPGRKQSERIVAAIEASFPHLVFPRRSREATGKVLLPFRCAEVVTKRVLKVEGGMIEVLGDGQQWIAESTYIRDGKADGRYLWPAGWPKALEDIPLLTLKELDELCGLLEMLFAIGDGWTIARAKREPGTGVATGPRPGGDEISNWLLEHWEVHEELPDGKLFIDCPWKADHSMDSGPSETQFAPPDSRYEKGHFHCLHAGCGGRSDAEFLEAMGFGYSMDDAPELPQVADDEPRELEPAKPAARYITDKQGRKEARQYNHELFLRDVDAVGLDIAWDDYTAQIVWRRVDEEGWRTFGDEHYAAIVRAMDRNGFVVQQPASIRAAVYAHAVKHRVDTFADWVAKLPKWDGVERVETFWVDYAGAKDTPYIRAVAMYSWTAQAGRALDPGCQADMVPILVSKQGTRKTSLIRAIAPQVEQFVEINLMDRDDDTTRKMRGKSVVELGELRGMHSRAKEDIKAFVTRRVEEWVPKYQEFAKQFKRRFVFYGTTNRDDFLADETGERRYLPFEVGEDVQLDVEGVERDRLQLWAEAAALWRDGGIRWRDAERLAAGEHSKFKETDAWTPVVRRWLLEDDVLAGGAPVDRPYRWSTDDVLVGALGFKTSQIGHGEQIRMGKVLKALGCWHKRDRRVGKVYRAFRADLERGGSDDLFA